MPRGTVEGFVILAKIQYGRRSFGNFFPMALRVKILVAIIGFWGTRNALNPLSNCSRGILAEFGGFCHFLWFLSVFREFLLLMVHTDIMVTGNILNLFSILIQRYFI